MLVGERASFPLAEKLRQPGGAPLADVFSFLSGLYFRGKLACARAFSRPPPGVPGLRVITSSRGLLPAETPVTVRCLREFAAVPIDVEESRFRNPLARDALSLASKAGEGCEFVLLGSIATPKYVDVLREALGDRIRFPEAFVGRGDMSRGGLMLRCVDDRRELTYAPLKGGLRRGPRPPRLEPRRAPAANAL